MRKKIGEKIGEDDKKSPAGHRKRRAAAACQPASVRSGVRKGLPGMYKKIWPAQPAIAFSNSNNSRLPDGNNTKSRQQTGA
jgi:hypothetical protein